MTAKSYAMEYGNRCRQIRMAKGLSQSDVAEKMFTTPQNVSSWERSGISDVDKIKQLSEVLGQDIMADEIDQEGTVGEVGKEILTILVNHQGYYEFGSLVSELYGLPEDRVSNEIFKLERIGTVVREQYKDWLDKDRDGVFITAKGIITIKNATNPMIAMCLKLQETVPYEKRLKGHINFNDRIHKDEVSRLIWKLPSMESSYRVCYIDYLVKNYMEAFPNEDKTTDELFNDHLLPGVSCYFDIIYCLALGYDNRTFELTEEMMEGYEEEMWEEEQRVRTLSTEAGAVYPDEVVSDSQRHFEEIFPWLGSKIETIETKNREIRNRIYEKENEELKAELGENYEIEAVEELWQPRFELYVGDRADKLCDEWFTDEQILDFIEENFKPAATEHEHMVDDLIKKINKLNPNTMDYYYHFPESWEKNGTAQKIRDIWGLPSKNGWRDLFYEETEE